MFHALEWLKSGDNPGTGKSSEMNRNLNTEAIIVEKSLVSMSNFFA